MKMRAHWEEVNLRRLRVFRSLEHIIKPVILTKVMRLITTLPKTLKRVIHPNATVAELKELQLIIEGGEATTIQT